MRRTRSMKRPYGWFYTLTVPVASSLLIDMEATSGTLDAYYERCTTRQILSSPQTTTAEQIRNARIQYPFTPGTYTIFATRYEDANGSSSGSFFLSVTQ